MKKLITFLFALILAQFVIAQATWFGPNYTHSDSSANCFNNYTLLDTLALPPSPGDLLIFNHVYGTLNGSHTAYMKHNCGLWYADPEWSVFDETGSVLDTNLAFNVLNPKFNGTAFVHTVTVANTSGNVSEIDHPLLNKNPNAVFFITKTWDNMVYDTTHVGIWYSPWDSVWTVYNEDGNNPLQDSLTFNIFIPNASTSYFKHVAVDSAYITVLNNPLLDGHPEARIFVVHDYTNDSLSEGYVNDEIGVWYNGANWTIYAETAPHLFPGAAFDVLIVSTVDNTGITENAKPENNVSISPNPATDHFVLQALNNFSMQDVTSVELFDITGRNINNFQYYIRSKDAAVVNISNLCKGVYFARILTKSGCAVSKQFIKL
jgi:hypothetical protein